MTYFEFLSRWYNLAFLLLAVAGVGELVRAKIRGEDRFRAAATMLIVAVAGLTWNGAIHDLGLGSAGPRFPWVLAGSAAIGWLGGRWVDVFRRRHLRPITAVRFHREGHEGVEARLVSRSVGPAPASGRAQWQDEEGELHIVRVHTEGAVLGFGRRVVLDAFDPTSNSYRVHPLRRRRKGLRKGRSV